MLFDENKILQFTGGDRNIAKSITEIFIKDCDNYISTIENAIQQNDMEQLKLSFHSIKTSSGFCGSSILEKESEHLFKLSEEKELEAIKNKSPEYLSNLKGLKALLEEHTW